MLNEAIGLLKELLGPLYEYVYVLASAFLRFVQPGNFHWMFFATALPFAVWFYLRHVRDAQSPARPGFLRWLLPREIYLHRSAIVDYKYFFINSMFQAKVIPLLIVGLPVLLVLADAVRGLLTGAFGPPETDNPPSFGMRFAYTVAMVLAFDFAKWYAHYLEHRVGFLWEFHKVHHSAEVLTPLTNSRAHPVDLTLEQLLVGLVSGPVAGVFGWLHPQQVTEITLWNMGIIYLAYNLTQHLRHSHVPIGFGKYASHVFSSPAMHQIHHSVEPRHWDRNYALMFSLWDTLAGTNYIPREREQFRLGLPDEEHRRFGSVTALYFGPFAAVGRRIRRRLATG